LCSGLYGSGLCDIRYGWKLEVDPGHAEYYKL
jgi:hypothetical protein